MFEVNYVALLGLFLPKVNAAVLSQTVSTEPLPLL